MKRTGNRSILGAVGIFAAAIASLSLSTVSHAETSVATVPEGYVTLTVAAGTGTGYRVTILSLPLLDTSTASGQLTGTITGVGTNTISNASAAWTAGQLSTAATPYILQVTSGTAKGRMFLLSTETASTATSVTIDRTETSDLTTLGIVAGTDTYELIPCDTLAGIFGTPETTGVLGATSAAQADQIVLLTNGSAKKYYYNTNLKGWRQFGTNSVSDNVPITPQAALMYSRLGDKALTFTVTGRVPSVDRSVSIKSSGTSLVSAGWPISITLTKSGIHQIAGWVSNTNPSLADQVTIVTNGSAKKYYHTGTVWKQYGPNTASDDVAIEVGSGVMIVKRGTDTSSVQLTQSIPYTP